MQISQIALEGMARAQEKLGATASRLARAADAADIVDLSAEMVAIIESRNEFALNAKVLRTAGECERRIIDELG